MWGKFTFPRDRPAAAARVGHRVLGCAGRTRAAPARAGVAAADAHGRDVRRARRWPTTVTIRWSTIDATPEEQRTFDAGHDSMRMGWTGTFEQLERTWRRRRNNGRGQHHLDLAARGSRARAHARVRRAARAGVQGAGRTPEHLAHWFGPKDFTLPFCEMDFRVGGAYRLCMRAPDGKDYWVRGVYREIVEPERLVFTWERDGADDPHAGHTLVTVTLEDLDAARRRSRCTRRRSTRPKSATATCGGWTECLRTAGRVRGRTSNRKDRT